MSTDADDVAEFEATAARPAPIDALKHKNVIRCLEHVYMYLVRTYVCVYLFVCKCVTNLLFSVSPGDILINSLIDAPVQMSMYHNTNTNTTNKNVNKMQKEIIKAKESNQMPTYIVRKRRI